MAMTMLKLAWTQALLHVRVCRRLAPPLPLLPLVQMQAQVQVQAQALALGVVLPALRRQQVCPSRRECCPHPCARARWPRSRSGWRATSWPGSRLRPPSALLAPPVQQIRQLRQRHQPRLPACTSEASHLQRRAITAPPALHLRQLQALRLMVTSVVRRRPHAWPSIAMSLLALQARVPAVLALRVRLQALQVSTLQRRPG